MALEGRASGRLRVTGCGRGLHQAEARAPPRADALAEAPGSLAEARGALAATLSREYGRARTILSLRRKDRSKGIIIDQQSVAEDLEQYGTVHRPFVVSMATWEDENDSHPMPYLRMFVAISHDTQRIARHFIESWIRVGTSGKDLQDLIDRYYAGA